MNYEVISEKSSPMGTQRAIISADSRLSAVSEFINSIFPEEYDYEKDIEFKVIIRKLYSYYFFTYKCTVWYEESMKHDFLKLDMTRPEEVDETVFDPNYIMSSEVY